MIKWINKKRIQKGFTLIELIVVIAILGILAAIAVPRFSKLRHEAAVKAEGATATSIANAARIQEVNTGKKVVGYSEAADDDGLKDEYITLTSEDKLLFTLEDGGDVPYKVKWESKAEGFGDQTYTESTAFNAVPTTPTTPTTP